MRLRLFALAGCLAAALPSLADALPLLADAQAPLAGETVKVRSS